MIVFGLSTPNFLFDEVQQHCHFVVVTGSSHCLRGKSPLGTVLIINLLGKGLTPPGGGYFRNFWVGVCRWDPGTLEPLTYTRAS